MKKNFNMRDNLKASLAKEQMAVKTKNKGLDIEQRLARAEAAFTDDNTNLKNKEQNAATKDKIKVIRDTFSLPENDYHLIEVCKQRGLEAQYNINKSEVVRAGLILLSKLSDKEFISAIKHVTKIKTGRRKK